MINLVIALIIILFLCIGVFVMIEYESYKYMSTPSSCLIADLKDTVPLSMYEIANLDEIGKKIVKTYIEDHNTPMTYGMYRLYRGNADYNLKQLEREKTNAQILKDQAGSLDVKI